LFFILTCIAFFFGTLLFVLFLLMQCLKRPKFDVEKNKDKLEDCTFNPIQMSMTITIENEDAYDVVFPTLVPVLGMGENDDYFIFSSAEEEKFGILKKEIIHVYPSEEDTILIKTYKKMQGQDERVRVDYELAITPIEDAEEEFNDLLDICQEASPIFNRIDDDFIWCNENRRLFAIINPHSGVGNARESSLKVLKMFKEALIPFDIFETQSKGHAKEMMKEFNPEDYDTIVVFSGDGLIQEVVDGIMEYHGPEKLKQIHIGVIPCGSGNGFVHTATNCSKDFMLPALSIIQNTKKKVDLIQIDRISQAGAVQTTSYSCLGLSYGIICDVDLESEWLRFLGDLRFVVYSLYFLIFGTRYYPMELQMDIDDASFPNGKFEDIQGTLSEDHLYLNTDFLLFYMGKAKFMTIDMIGLPYSNLNDGYIDVSLIPKGCSKWQQVKMFVGLFTGNCHKYGLQCIKTKKMTIKINKNYYPKAKMALDGEQYPVSSLSCSVLQHAFSTFS